MSEILLSILLQDSDSSFLKNICHDKELHKLAKDFLEDAILKDKLLNIDTYTTTSTTSEVTQKTEQRHVTLTEEIAELESSIRYLNNDLVRLGDDNRDVIVNVGNDLISLHNDFALNFEKKLSDLEKHLKEFGLDTMDDKEGEIKLLDLDLNEQLTSKLKANTLVLAHIDSILDLLELPTLCRLCVSQGNYSGAFDISVFIQSLQIKFPKLKIFEIIEKQVEKELNKLAKKLIILAGTDLKQGALIKVFQALKRLNFLDENKINAFLISPREKEMRKEKLLRIIFLDGRFRFIQKEISNLMPLIKHSKLTYLKRCIEIYREHLFSSLSTYYSIFYNYSTVEQNSNDDDNNYLISYFIKKLADILVNKVATLFSEYLSDHKIDSIEKDTQKDGLMLQLVYLCRSLSKYHLNFENIIANGLIFERNIFSEQEWITNTEKLTHFKS